MKRLVIGTLLAILLLFVSACSENHTFRVTHWGMSVEEVRQTESLELTDANEVSPQTLIYAYPTTGSGESEVMYIFPDEFNQTLNAAAYWYRLEPLEERTILLQNLRMDLSESYGPPHSFENSHFKGYTWEDEQTVLRLYDDIGAGAVVELYYSKDYLEFML
ncbi:hypothetical protein [Paenibacillus sp. FSL K6-1230]|uniref:hypothetical protein n=1 Tax=Paenibacillus sp. FSL K6-1230 TaxID=2921603 RepID=UPI0030FBB4DE